MTTPLSSLPLIEPSERAEQIGARLHSTGVCQLRLDPPQQAINKQGFELFKNAIADEARLEPSCMIPTGIDSSIASGYHKAGGLSRYNSYRTGVVFSNGTILNLCSGDDGSFVQGMQSWIDSLCGMAAEVLLSIGEYSGMERHDAVSWVESIGDLKNCSQWHVKRFVPLNLKHSYSGSSSDCASITKPSMVTDTGEARAVLLPLHTDPSIISIVIHDRSGVEEGCLGLQFRDLQSGQYHELPSCGHLVATVLVGSLLEKISCGFFPASKHRVVAPSLDEVLKVRDTSPESLQPGGTFRRVVATFFFRPHDEFELSPMCGTSVAKLPVRGGPFLRYSEWKKKTANKYESKKPKSKVNRSKKPK